MNRFIKQISGRNITALALAFSLGLSMFVTSCKSGDDKKLKPADYGSYGADFARQLAKDFPDRAPYSEGEKSAGEVIRQEMVKLKYEPCFVTIKIHYIIIDHFLP